MIHDYICLWDLSVLTNLIYLILCLRAQLIPVVSLVSFTQWFLGKPVISLIFENFIRSVHLRQFHSWHSFDMIYFLSIGYWFYHIYFVFAIYIIYCAHCINRDFILFHSFTVNFTCIVYFVCLMCLSTSSFGSHLILSWFMCFICFTHFNVFHPV